MTTPAPATGTLDPDEVQVGAANGPGLYIGPPGTDPPDETSDTWPAPWAILGYLSDDGVTISPAVETTDLVPWQSAVPLKSVVTSRGVTIQAVLWQLNARTLALYFDAPVPTPDADGAIHMDIRSDAPQQLYAIGVDSADGDTAFRLAFRRATLSAAGDMVINRGAAVPLDVTLSALDDAGNLASLDLGPRAAAPETNGLASEAA